MIFISQGNTSNKGNVKNDKNVLHNFNNVTYHLSLYAVNKSIYNAYSESNELDITTLSNHQFGPDRVVIAETAATAMTINNLSVTSAPGQQENNIVTTVSFDLIQPYGMSLAERLVACAGVLGWESAVSDIVFMLSIKFNGYDSSGNPIMGIEGGNITYPIKMRQFQTSFTNSGAVYNVTASVLGSMDKYEPAYYLHEQMTINDITSVSDFFEKLKTQMNEMYKKDTTKGQIVFDEIDFDVSDEISSITPYRVMDDKASKTDQPMNGNKNMGATVTLSHNSSIPKIVEHVLIHNEKIQSYITEKNEFSKVLSIEPRMQLKAFDKTLGRYARKVIWTVRLVSRKRINYGSTDHNIRISEFLEHAHIEKSYSYYFSGTNAEVIDVNIDMNNYTYSKMAAYGALFSNIANQQGFLAQANKSFDEYFDILAIEDDLFGVNSSSSNTTNNNGFSLITSEKRSDDATEDDVDYGVIQNEKNLMNKESVDYQHNPTTFNADSITSEIYAEIENIRDNFAKSANSVDINIKGDPYWLIPMQQNIKYKNQDSTKLRGIVFEIGYPRSPDKLDGTRPDRYYSGFYIVNTVVSNFNNGKFTQKLSCKRVQGTSFKDIEQYGSTN